MQDMLYFSAKNAPKRASHSGEVSSPRPVKLGHGLLARSYLPRTVFTSLVQTRAFCVVCLKRKLSVKLMLMKIFIVITWLCPPFFNYLSWEEITGCAGAVHLDQWELVCPEWQGFLHLGAFSWSLQVILREIQDSAFVRHVKYVYQLIQLRVRNCCVLKCASFLYNFRHFELIAEKIVFIVFGFHHHVL